MDTYDVFAVNIETGTIRFFGQNKTKANAQAIVTMAVYRRGCDEEFYAIAPAGQYKDGDTWQGPEND